MARTPKYKAAETEMITRIKNGTWEIGRRLPNEFELAEEFGVSQGTMRRALISLEGMGLLNRKPGRGTLVAANEPSSPTAVSSAPSKPRIVDAHGAPLELEPFRSRASTRGATEAEQVLFGTKRVSTLSRLHKINGARAVIEDLSVPENLISALDEDGPVELAALLANEGISVARTDVVAQAEMTDMSLSVSLSVDRHTALLAVSMTAYDASDTPVAQQVLRIATPGARLTFV